MTLEEVRRELSEALRTVREQRVRALGVLRQRTWAPELLTCWGFVYVRRSGCRDGC